MQAEALLHFVVRCSYEYRGVPRLIAAFGAVPVRSRNDHGRTLRASLVVAGDQREHRALLRMAEFKLAGMTWGPAIGFAA